MLATDGLKSFAIFLYADGEIQWTTGDASGGSRGLGGTPAHAGYNAGDGIRFALLPESDTPEIINIDTTSNVGVPGVWMFEVDEENIAVGVCSNDSETEGTHGDLHSAVRCYLCVVISFILYMMVYKYRCLQIQRTVILLLCWVLQSAGFFEYCV